MSINSRLTRLEARVGVESKTRRCQICRKLFTPGPPAPISESEAVALIEDPDMARWQELVAARAKALAGGREVREWCHKCSNTVQNDPRIHELVRRIDGRIMQRIAARQAANTWPIAEGSLDAAG
jgi:hypothetical protein